MQNRRTAAAGRRLPLHACRIHQGDASTSLAAPAKPGAGGRIDRGADGGQSPQHGAPTKAATASNTATNGSQGANLGGKNPSEGGGAGAGAAEAGGAAPIEPPGAAQKGGPAGPGSASAPPLRIKVAYSMGGGRCTCDGIKVGTEGFDKYNFERVGPRRADAEGMRMVERVLADAESSGFRAPALDRLRTPPRPPGEPWRAGEALAECYLEDFENASFPHPRLRDERNPYASPAGPDLVGYIAHGGEVVFLFGEVKTTGATTRPPDAAGRLRNQLERRLAGRGTIHLLHYLMKKAESGSDEADKRRNREALRSYAERRWMAAGVLISDQDPDRKDLEAAFANLEKRAGRIAASLRLVALYVPVPIGSLGGPAGRGA